MSAESIEAAEFADLPSRWRKIAATLERYGAKEQAAAMQRCAEELEVTLRQHAHEALKLEQAAEESGYDAEYLGQLVRTGQLPNAGKKHAPRILRRDLPRKPPGVRGAGRVAQAPEENALLHRITRDAISSRTPRS